MAGQQPIELSETAPGRFQVRGELTLATARRALDAGRRAMRNANGAAVEVDCSQITASDSAGLAVLLEWLAAARQAGHELSFVNVPAQLCAVARISELDGIF
jgi:phospholipid transport system transporter-binding protein